MITKITFNVETDNPDQESFTLDLSTPGVSFFLEHLGYEISPNTQQLILLMHHMIKPRSPSA